MRLKWDVVFTATLVVCALVTTAIVIRHELLPAQVPSPQGRVAKPAFIADWKSQMSAGTRLGPISAAVQLIEFADFECPFCASFHQALKTLRERYPTQVSLTYIHLPLPGHRFAIPAAQAAECAGRQGRFEAMHDRLFDGQDSFGIKPWSDYATEAGIADLAAFAACMKNTAPIQRVETGKQLAAKLGIAETPTLMINGWRLARPSTLEELEKMTKAVLSGKSPVADQSGL